MNVDLHTHTFPASGCSAISGSEYVEWCVTHGVEAMALTNHGDVSDNRGLGRALAEVGVVLIDGVEISTLFGDFLIFAPDLDYLATFADVQGMPRAGDVPADAAVVWAHPAAGGGRSGSAYFPGIERMVADVVDAVEVYNGNWLEARYVDEAERVAALLGLPRTGGSDAHRVDRLTTCYTELPDPVRCTADVVAAIKSGAVVPRRREKPFRRRRLGIF